jgi:hypothetical protein
MRGFSVLLTVALLLGLGLGLSVAASAQTSCTGLACEQITTCSAGQTTSVNGVVYAPNGTDPLPNVTVYVPNDTVQPFTPGVDCPISGSPLSGSPLVGTITDVNGKFTIVDMPVGLNIPIVAVSGRWRVQSTVNTTACAPTAINLNMPTSESSLGDIPKIAIATGAVDQVECVLLKMGISPTEFTDPDLGGRINLFLGSTPPTATTGPGSGIDTGTPTQASLMIGDNLNDSLLSQYDVLMLPCQGTADNNVDSDSKGTGKATSLLGTQELANFIAFANAGGRVYSSHYSYAWMFNNSPFNGVVNWAPNSTQLTSGTATVNTGFTAGQTLSTWLQDVGASTGPGQMDLDTLRIDQTGVIAPTQSWLTLNQSMGGVANPVMQFVFDTPIPSASNPKPNQCGRVLYNEYHVENSNSSTGTTFPHECNTSAAMTPQEKLLEYMLFELTDEGGQPSLAPTSQDFGSEAVNYPTAAQTFTWTNNSSFAAQVTSATIGGTNGADFTATNNCGAVAGGANCLITVVFTPSLIGAESATLNVVSAGNTLSATLTGTGVPGYSVSTTTMNFGNVVVGDASSQTLTLVSNASGAQAVPTSTINVNNYTISTAACGLTVAAGGSCVATVTFLPTTLGALPGTLTINSSGSPLTVSLTGTGIPGFTLTPATLSFGNQDVGFTSSPPLTLTLTSVARRALATPVFTTTGNYSYSTAACGLTMIAQTSCLVAVTFTPLATGPLTGTLADNSTNPVYSGLSTTMTGNGVDFSISLNPTGGSVVAGDGTTTTATLTPIAGYSSPLTLSCAVTPTSTTAVCSLSTATLTLTAAATTVVSMGTTSQYTVIGYSGYGGRGLLWLLAAASGGLLWRRRRLTPVLLCGLLLVLLGGLTSCTGKLPAENAAWTAPGNYSVTVTATDGQLMHRATYSLTVTAK